MDQADNKDYPEMIEDEINLIDLIYPIFKRRRFLLLFCFLCIVAVGVWTFLTPKTYEATAVILPEAKDTGAGGELKAAFLEQFGVSGLGGASAAPAELFEAILKSRDLAREVLKRYNFFFVKGIHPKDREIEVDRFVQSVKVKKSRKEPTVSVTVSSHDPVLAADLANSYVLELDEFNQNNTVTTAQRLRKYIEGRLEAANRELEEVQEELRKFQEQNRAISISRQAEATLNVLSELEAKRVALEVEKAAKEQFYNGPHIEIEQLKAQMGAIQKNIDRLMHSSEKTVSLEREKGRVEFYIPLTRIPALNFDESKLLLKVKAKTGVVTMLTTQLEQAKLDETKDMPTISVLDWAKPTKKPVKPKILLNLVLGAMVSFFIGIFLVFLKEYSYRLEQNPETAQKWQEMRQGISLFKRRRTME